MPDNRIREDIPAIETSKKTVRLVYRVWQNEANPKGNKGGKNLEKGAIWKILPPQPEKEAEKKSQFKLLT